MRNAHPIRKLLLCLFCCALFTLTLSLPAGAATDYTLFGDARKSGSVIRLTPAEYWCRGSAWFKKPIPVTDGMTVSFEYRVYGGESSNLGYADGFVLNFSPEKGLGGSGESLGFYGYGAYGVEFDSYWNSGEGDPENPHVAIIKDSVGNHLVKKVTSLAICNNWTKAKITFKEKKMELYLGGRKYLSKSSVRLPNEVYVGVTASTGAGYACHEIRNLIITGVDGKKKIDYTTNKRYSITYVLNNGKNDSRNPKTYFSEKSFTLYTPSREGYKCSGWYLNGKKVTKIKKGTTGNLTLEAKWTRVKRTSVNADPLKVLRKKYPDVKKLTSKGTFELPGLVSTKFKNGECDAMTPQGICVAENHLLITAYCGINGWKEDLEAKKSAEENKDLLALEKDHKAHNSVLYVLNKKTGALQSTIELPDKNHVGGITFDGENVWIAGSRTKTVRRVSYQTIKDLAASGKTAKLTAYEYTSDKLDIPSVSFLTYFDNKLWIGLCPDLPKYHEVHGYLKVYELIKDNKGERIVKSKAKYYCTIPTHGNGCEIVKKGRIIYLFINKSPGRNLPSTTYVYQLCIMKKARLKKRRLREYTLPPMAEEICFDKDSKTFYTIFESGAAHYSTVKGNKAKYVTDLIFKGTMNYSIL